MELTSGIDATGACAFRCRQDASCLPHWSQVCDGRADCSDRSDEVACPPALLQPIDADGPQAKPFSEVSGVQICIVAVSLVLTLGLITCVINHYNKMGGRSWTGDQRRQDTSRKTNSTATFALYSPAQTEEQAKKEVLLKREHQLRMLSVQRDFALDLPSSVCRPDGEENPRARCWLYPKRNEVPRTYVKPPPNRTAVSADIFNHGHLVPLVHEQRTRSSIQMTGNLVSRNSLKQSSFGTSCQSTKYSSERWQPPGNSVCSLDLFSEMRDLDPNDPPPKYEDVCDLPPPHPKGACLPGTNKHH